MGVFSETERQRLRGLKVKSSGEIRKRIKKKTETIIKDIKEYFQDIYLLTKESMSRSSEHLSFVSDREVKQIYRVLANEIVRLTNSDYRFREELKFTEETVKKLLQDDGREITIPLFPTEKSKQNYEKWHEKYKTNIELIKKLRKIKGIPEIINYITELSNKYYEEKIPEVLNKSLEESSEKERKQAARTVEKPRFKAQDITLKTGFSLKKIQQKLTLLAKHRLLSEHKKYKKYFSPKKEGVYEGVRRMPEYTPTPTLYQCRDILVNLSS